MLSQTYISKVESLRFVNPYATFIAVTRFNPRFDYDIWCRKLAPSVQLLKDYKEGKINWTEYVSRFKKEMYCRQPELRRLAIKASTEDVYLVCFEKRYPCHRFILLDLIEELAKKENISVEIIKGEYLQQQL